MKLGLHAFWISTAWLISACFMSPGYAVLATVIGIVWITLGILLYMRPRG